MCFTIDAHENIIRKTDSECIEVFFLFISYAMILSEGNHEDRWIDQGLVTADAENMAA